MLDKAHSRRYPGGLPAVHDGDEFQTQMHRHGGACSSLMLHESTESEINTRNNTHAFQSSVNVRG
jgi:hypothetical protein